MLLFKISDQPGRVTLDQLALAKDLTGVNLSHNDYSNSSPGEINLSEADLSITNFAGADVSKVSFVGADLYGADFRNSIASSAISSEQLRIRLPPYWSKFGWK